MKPLLIFVFLVSAGFCDDQYTTKYDNIDIDEICHSERLLKNYMNCIMDRGPCTPDATELRRLLPDALQTECVKCSDKQKEMAKKMIGFLVKSKPDMWKELSGKYDPDGSYFEKFKKQLD